MTNHSTFNRRQREPKEGIRARFDRGHEYDAMVDTFWSLFVTLDLPDKEVSSADSQSEVPCGNLWRHVSQATCATAVRARLEDAIFGAHARRHVSVMAAWRCSYVADIEPGSFQLRTT